MDSKEGDKKLSPVGDGEKETAEPITTTTTTVAERPAATPSAAEPQPKSSEADTPTNTGAEDAANDADLSSPPDSSSVSSVNPDMLGDEIVVGTRANGGKSPARRAVQEQEDVTMADTTENGESVSHYPKRKRTSLYNDLSDETIEGSFIKDTDEPETSSTKGKPRHKFDEDNKHVPIGYWRDSPVPHEDGKHMVVGFIDVRDRLRTRIRGINLKGDSINSRLFRIPPGPGGSWVTFERIVFLDHLVGHDHNLIKEYVKVRADTLKDDGEEADIEAVREAQRRLEANPPPETPQPPIVAWGRVIHAQAYAGRHEAKKRRRGSASGTISERLEQTERTEPPEQLDQPRESGVIERVRHTPLILPTHEPPQPQVPRKPTRILVGVWSKSSSPNDDDKHAVYGILGANDMFRVKLVRETKDGRFVDGNFPSGAGALWIAYDEAVMLDHIKHLTRPEVKEYVRIRQLQIDAGETKDDQIANETKAVHEAQIRAAAIAAATPNKAHPQGHAGPALPSSLKREEVRETHELRQPRREVASRSVEPFQASPYAIPDFPEVEIRPASRNTNNDPIERVQGFANREVARMEAVQLRTDRRQANKNAVASPLNAMNVHDTRRDFNENVQRMNHVWRAQESMRQGPENGIANGEVMMHQGVKYERKQNGPFKDRLVSQGTIINIDGEDYVEYRVLTKPSFF